MANLQQASNVAQPRCPCRLTQEQLDRHGLVGAGGVCTAVFADGSGAVCGRPLGAHPHTPAGSTVPATGTVGTGAGFGRLVRTFLVVGIFIGAIWFTFTKSKEARKEFVKSAFDWIIQDGLSNFFWYDGEYIVSIIIGGACLRTIHRVWSSPSHTFQNRSVGEDVESSPLLEEHKNN